MSKIRTHNDFFSNFVLRFMASTVWLGFRYYIWKRGFTPWCGDTNALFLNNFFLPNFQSVSVHCVQTSQDHTTNAFKTHSKNAQISPVWWHPNWIFRIKTKKFHHLYTILVTRNKVAWKLFGFVLCYLKYFVTISGVFHCIWY